MVNFFSRIVVYLTGWIIQYVDSFASINDVEEVSLGQPKEGCF